MDNQDQNQPTKKPKRLDEAALLLYLFLTGCALGGAALWAKIWQGGQ